MKMGKLLRSYVFWTYERGSFHYDVMVTLILAFLFLAPRVIDFKDRPVETFALHASEVLVREAGSSDGCAGSSDLRSRRQKRGSWRELWEVQGACQEPCSLRDGLHTRAAQTEGAHGRGTRTPPYPHSLLACA